MNYTYTDMLAHLNISSAHPSGLSSTKETWEKLKPYNPKVILDVGYGTGKTLAYLTENTTAHLMGIDKSKAMIKKARERLEHKEQVDLMLGDMIALPLADISIDCILSESVTSFVEPSTALNEYFRVLKKNGVLCLIEVTATDSLSQHELNELNSFYGTHTILTKAEWESQLDEAGFIIIEHHPIVATSEGDNELDLASETASIFFEFLAYHYHLIEKMQNQLIGYFYFCQKK